MTEREMLDKLVEYVKANKIRVPSPDYKTTHYYGDQWKAFGAQYYYQLPRKGKIIATAHRVTGVYQFDTNGFDEEELVRQETER